MRFQIEYGRNSHSLFAFTVQYIKTIPIGKDDIIFVGHPKMLYFRNDRFIGLLGIPAFYRFSIQTVQIYFPVFTRNKDAVVAVIIVIVHGYTLFAFSFESDGETPCSITVAVDQVHLVGSRKQVL